jgi:hypothetical protein
MQADEERWRRSLSDGASDQLRAELRAALDGRAHLHAGANAASVVTAAEFLTRPRAPLEPFVR